MLCSVLPAMDRMHAPAIASSTEKYSKQFVLILQQGFEAHELCYLVETCMLVPQQWGVLQLTSGRHS